MKTDVIIVGGGIGGSVLAALLGRAGKRVIVMERDLGPPPWVRPEILWPRTVQTLDELIPDDDLAKAMIPLRGIKFWKRDAFEPVIEPAHFASAGVQPWSTNPNVTRERMLGLDGFELRRGVEVTGLLVEEGRVVGVRARESSNGREFEILADWTIGDDGGKSFVRQECGIDLNTRLFPLEFLCFEFPWPKAFAADCVHVIPNVAGVPGGFAALAGVPLPGGKGAGIVPVFGNTYDSAAWPQWMNQYPASSEILGERRFPDDLAHLKRYWGHAGRYGIPGALLMGDAIHPPSPAGGQGANMAVADARTLARLLIENRPEILSEYERIRRPANNRSLRPTRAANFILGLPPVCRSILPGGFFARRLSNSPAAVTHLLRLLASSFQSADDFAN